MKNKLIYERLIATNKVYKLDDYVLPTGYRSGVRITNVKMKREGNLKSNYNRDYPTNRNFSERFKVDRKEFEYIEEFPVFIDNRKLWESICEKHKPTEYNKFQWRDWCKNKNKQTLYIDYFFPNMPVPVFLELDSYYYHREKWKDEIRDEYIKTRFGIDTIRIIGFGYDDEEHLEIAMKELTEKLNEFLNNNDSGKKKIDFTKCIVNGYKKANKEAIYIIDTYVNQYIKPGMQINMTTLVNGIQDQEDKELARKNYENIIRVLEFIYKDVIIVTRW